MSQCELMEWVKIRMIRISRYFVLNYLSKRDTEPKPVKYLALDYSRGPKTQMAFSSLGRTSTYSPDHRIQSQMTELNASPCRELVQLPYVISFIS